MKEFLKVSEGISGDNHIRIKKRINEKSPGEIPEGIAGKILIRKIQEKFRKDCRMKSMKKFWKKSQIHS